MRLPSRLMQSWKPVLVSALITLTILAWLAVTVIQRTLYVASANAAIEGDYGMLASRISGVIASVWVQANQPVRKGQILCVIDDRPFRAKLRERAALEKKAASDLALARNDFQRAWRLWRERTIPGSELDHARSTLETRTRELDRARALSRQARLNLTYTRIIAPEDERLAFRSAQPGMHVRAGLPLFGFVTPNRRWLNARIKETDLRDVRIGKPVQIRIDASSGKTIQGQVEMIGPASEAPFAVVPPDRSAGNFNKYVQWMPIRVSLPLSPGEIANLPVGLTSSVRMRRS